MNVKKVSDPRYIPKEQARRMDQKARIEMPYAESTLLIDRHVSDHEIQKVFIGVTNLESQLVLFSHEFAHHLTNSPGYDAALSRCLRLPTISRDFADMITVITEEAEAWSKGFNELKLLGFESAD